MAKEVTPFVNEWDEAGEFPRELYAKAADVGILGAGFPEEYGGIGTDAFLRSPNEAAAPTWPGCAPRRNETATTERPATVLLPHEVGGRDAAVEVERRRVGRPPAHLLQRGA